MIEPLPFVEQIVNMTQESSHFARKHCQVYFSFPLTLAARQEQRLTTHKKIMNVASHHDEDER